MCLSRVTHATGTTALPSPAKGVQKGFKVMSVGWEQGIETALTPCINCRVTVLPENEWVRDRHVFDLYTRYPLYGPTMQYETGFHVCKTLDGAKNFRSWINRGYECEGYAIYEVEVDELVAEGVQDLSMDGEPVYPRAEIMVGKKIKLGKKVEE